MMMNDDDDVFGATDDIFRESFQSSGRLLRFRRQVSAALRFFGDISVPEKCPPAPCACERRDARRHERRTVRLAASRGSVMSHSAGACLSIRGGTPPPSPATSDAKRRRPRSWFFGSSLRAARSSATGRSPAGRDARRTAPMPRLFARIRRRRHAIDARLAPALTAPRPHPRRLPRPSNAALGASRAPLAASPAREQGGPRVRRHHRAGVVSAGLTARGSFSLRGCRVVAGPAGARARRQIAVTPRASWSDKPSSAAPPGDDAARGSDWGAAPIPPMPPMPPPPFADAPASAETERGGWAPPARDSASSALRNGWDAPAPAPARESSPVLNASSPETRLKPGVPPPIDPDAIRITRGSPEILGPSPAGSNGVNFALHSSAAKSVDLCVYFDPDAPSTAPSLRIPLDNKENRTGDVWHVAVENIPRGHDGYVVRYGYLIAGDEPPRHKHDRWHPDRLLCDPYAPLVDGRRVFGDRSSSPRGEDSVWMGCFNFDATPFDWEGVKPPGLPPQDLVVYELTTRAFTADASSGLATGRRGSFLGIADKVQHLKDAGINAVELLPVFHFDEMEFQRCKNPRDHMLNTWGYSTMSFFAPMTPYASEGAGPEAAANEFKHMVKTLHANGIEVLLDVVYNHTGEGTDQMPNTFSFRGIDNKTYYMMEDSKHPYKNYTGCGNTFNCNHPVVQRLVLDSLRHWVEEYHVDGFRFDLTSAMTRGQDGEPLARPPVIREIAKDETLARTKLFAEPWDCGGLYQVGSFPNWDRWGEWNGKYRDVLRRFIKGDMGLKSELACRLCGSADMYHVNGRKPHHSLNFITAHDGFTLRDLVSYNDKHNDANGEQNRDGCNDNDSWNHGGEGESVDDAVKNLRWRQMKNFHLALMVSQGTPMVLMGDEYGHTRGGNNNTYGHDNHLNNFDWNALESVRGGYFRFHGGLCAFRVNHPLLGRAEFLNDGDVTWHEDNWDNVESRFLAFTLHDRGQGGGDLYIAFNAHEFYVDAALPPPPGGKSWHRVVDTNLPSPADFTPEGEPGCGARYNVAPRGSVMLVAK